MSGSFGAFSVSDNLVPRKRLWRIFLKNNLHRIFTSTEGPLGEVFSVYRYLSTGKWLRSFWGIRCISEFRQACILKMVVLERNGRKLGPRVTIQCK